jgi:rhodanese-related sulfurtransferase
LGGADRHLVWLERLKPRQQIVCVKRPQEMKIKFLFTSAVLIASTFALAGDRKYPQAKVSFDDFKTIVAAVEPHRATRLVDLNAFLKMSRDPGTIILDSRSDFRYERIHLKGAKHLSFTDFTQANLAKTIPSIDTKILIYCNNNFDGDQTDFATKQMVPLSSPRRVSPAEQFSAQSKPIMLALNIPTYINLYGYGYRNVYELDELVSVKDPRIAFEGSIVNPRK